MKSYKINIAVNGKSQKSIAMMPYELDLQTFAQSCSAPKKGGKHEAYWIRGGDMTMTYADKNNENPELREDHFHRNDSSLLTADVLVLDLDGSVDNPSSAPNGRDIHKTLVNMDLAHFIYSTHSHQTEGKGNRYRAVIPCKLTKKEHLAPTINRIINEIRSYECPIGDVPEAKVWSQAWFFPTRDDPEDGKFEYYEFFGGREYREIDADDKLERKLAERKREKERRKSREREEVEAKTHRAIVKTITEGRPGLHQAINDFLYGQIKDGVLPSVAILTVKGLMQADPDKNERWKQRYEDIERSADGADKRIREMKSRGAAMNFLEIKRSLGSVEDESVTPEYPMGTMKDWPEPWPQIWDNWVRFPAHVAEPLLVPTILAFHGYMLNGKYLNARDRRPNLYQLALAESTAYKDTNSSDVLRAMPKAMAAHGFFNSVFDRIASGDSSITSDTAFLKNLEGNAGKKFWLNTEATRVFQQLSAQGRSPNPNVLGLADKIIEVVDGKAITGKTKAQERVSAIEDPNVQIVFYAQPETIRKYISEEMVDSGFLGRALITLDVERMKPHSMFTPLPQNFCNLDEDLAGFYGNCNLTSQSLFERKNLHLDGENLVRAIEFENNTLKPMMPDDDSALRKMITRMGNSTEQLYSIVCGVCREWDEWSGNDIRESVDIAPLFPLLNFWAECKSYVVNHYIVKGGDPISDACIEAITKILEGEWKLDKKYDQSIEFGMVPRSILVNRMRIMKKVKRCAEQYNRLTIMISQTIDSMIANEILGQVEEKVGRSRKKSKLIYVNK